MPQYNDTLRDLRGSLQLIRPGLDSALADRLINYRMRQILDARPYWSAMIGRGVLGIPQAYTTGTISLTQGSNLVTGVGNAWPVSDVVNTTTTSAITNIGYQLVAPASMTGITTDTLLYVDANGPNPEVVPVLEVSPQNFRANFQFPHDTGSTLTASSLAYRQLKVGFQFPIYTVTAVIDATDLLLDQPWAGAALAATSYSIQQMYYTFKTDLRDFIAVVDPQNGETLALHYPREQLDWDDPQRAANDWPQYVVDYSQNLNGNMQWELYPSPTSARQLYFTYVKQIPDMKAATDRPPAFLDPSIIVMGAAADAFKVRVPNADPRGDLQISMMWEQRFTASINAAMDADNSKRQAAYTWARAGFGRPGGANFWQAHDEDVWFGRY